MSGQLPSLTERLAARLSRPVDAAARARARLHLLDWLGCVWGAAGTPLAAVAGTDPGPLTRAALRGNLLEMDDVDRLGRLHPGPVIWPAALSAARERGAGFGHLLDAGVAGYEAMIAVGRMLDDWHYAHWHPTATAGAPGAAAAASRLFRLDAGATAAAMGNALSVAGGLWRMRHEPVMTKAMHAAHAALMGLWQARLAARGFTGPRLILEGEQGFFAGLTRAPRAIVPDAPGWALFEVSFKPHAACRHAHPAIDAALALRERGVPAEAIEVRAYADAVAFCDRPEPRTPAEAKFSLQHAVAVAMVRGAAGLRDFTEEAINDPAVAAVRAGVGVVEDPALTARYPAHFGAVVTAAGETEARADALGDPEAPMTDDAVAAKARELLAHGGMKRGARERLIERVLTDGDDADTPAWLARKMRRL